MKAKVTVTETVSEKMDLLQQQFEDDVEEILQKLADAVTGTDEDDFAPIPSLMSTEFNPNLYMSGQERRHRFVKKSKNQSVITIVYTGMDLHEIHGDDAKVWWEFAEDLETDPKYRKLERDYAYYQETGMDPIAEYSDAHHVGAINTGLGLGVHYIEKELVNQMELLFTHLK